MNASPACTQQSTPMPSPYAWMVAAQRLQPIPLQTPMRVSLACVENRVDVSLRFGKPVRETVLDRWRRVVTFMPGAVCCRFKWLGNDFGTALWQLVVLQAPEPLDDMQRVAGVTPGAHLLLRANGKQDVLAALAVIDAIEQIGIDPCTVAAGYWRMLGHRLAADLPLSAYTAEWHAALLARGGRE